MKLLGDDEERIVSDSEDWADYESLSFVSSKEVAFQTQGVEPNVFLRKNSRVKVSTQKQSHIRGGSDDVCQPREDSAHQEDAKDCVPTLGLSWEVDVSKSKTSNTRGSRKIAKHSFLDKDPSILDAKLRRERKNKREIVVEARGSVVPGDRLQARIAREASTIRMHKRDDGATVITASHNGDNNREEPVKVKGNEGWGNNFVRLNLKKFNSNIGRVKGAGRFKRKFKSKWRNEPMKQVGDGANYMSGWEHGSSIRCYKCGQTGHFSSSCTNGPTLDPNSCSEEDMPYNDEENPDLTSSPLDGLDAPSHHKGSLYKWSVENCEEDITQVLENKFGYMAFRGNQKDTILKVLHGESCLNIMPTGMGKSLCYQLPAFLLEKPVVVISPLIALMQDQCAAAPSELRPAILWSGQTPREAKRILGELKNGNIRLLFLSPERVTNQHFLEAIKPWLPLELLVIDEAHCISEWGHSFRPSYFRLGNVIRSEIPCKSILALTATATVDTEICMRESLGIKQESTFRWTEMQSNIAIGIQMIGKYSTNADKWRDIVKRLTLPLLHSTRAIVYCSFRKDADDLARALAVAGVRAKPYHSGTLAAERERILSSFSKGVLKAVVATTAFGMGVNITNVDLVVHASMPRSLEEYVQQIGRAGRLGQHAKCICFLSQEDFLTLRSLAANPHINRKPIKELVGATIGNSYTGQYHIICSKDLSSSTMPEETIESILCYLENEDIPLLTYFGKVPQKARVSFYARPPEEMKEFTLINTILRCTKPRAGVYHVDVAALCSENGSTPARNFQELAALSQRGLIGFQASKEVGFCIRMNGIIDSKCINRITAGLSNWLQKVNSISIQKLDTAFKAFQATSLVDADKQGEALQCILKCYFTTRSTMEVESIIDSIASANNVQSKCIFPVKQGGKEIIDAVKAVHRRACQQNFELSAIEVTNILHGIDRDKSFRNSMGMFWGSMRNYDYKDVLKAAETLLFHSK